MLFKSALADVPPLVPGVDASSDSPAWRTYRIASLDLLRGCLMILMALDHTRAYFSAYRVDPVDPVHSWPALFLTRWITHLCAPGFIALAGVSVYLQRQRGKTAWQLGRLLVARGLWLVFLEITFISFGWSFVFPAPFLQVIWAIGIAMIALAALLRLPTLWIGIVGGLIVALHNFLDPIKAANLGRLADLWKMLHQAGILVYHGHAIGYDLYPVIPWVGIMCLGYAFGPVMLASFTRRSRVSITLAACFLAIFTLLRVHNGYGDPNHFQRLGTVDRSVMSFFNVEKYPPSLEYVLSTFAALLVLFVFLEFVDTTEWAQPLNRFVTTYGRVPFFYYILHIYLIHGAALIVSMALHRDWRFWVGTGYLTRGIPAGWGYSLPVVYAIWLAVVLVLYLPCLWFSKVKARRRDWWLSYL